MVMFDVEIHPINKEEPELHRCEKFEVRPATRFSAPKHAQEVLLYGTMELKINFPHRSDAAVIYETLAPIKVTPIEIEERSNDY